MSALVVKTPYGMARLVPDRYKAGGLALSENRSPEQEGITTL